MTRARGRVRRSGGVRRQTPLVLAAGLALLVIGVGIVIYLARDDDPDVSATVTDGSPQGGASRGGTEGGPETIAAGQVDRFAPLQNELPVDSRVNVSDTFAMNISTFSSSYVFNNNEEGERLAKQWGILDGFQVAYEPRGLAAEAIKGAYYINVEEYLFETGGGAHAAYEHIANRLKANRNAVVQEHRGLGNESMGVKLVSGPLVTSEITGVYHRFLFRRGNVVSVVQTLGGEPFMSLDQARDIAVIIDDKILEKRQAVEPTPIPTPSFGGG